MATLATVQDYLTEARQLLQDTVTPFRYTDGSMISALNMALLEARKLRPDLFIGRFTSIPSYTLVSDTVDFEPMYRSALYFYIAGHVGLAEDESTSEQRSTAFTAKFTSQLLTVQG